MLLYMALAPEAKLSAPPTRTPTHCLVAHTWFYKAGSHVHIVCFAAYKDGGPAAEARFEGGVAGFEARSFRGCGVFTSEPVRSKRTHIHTYTHAHLHVSR